MTRRALTLLALLIGGSLIVGLIAIGGQWAPRPANAQSDQTPTERTITVSGQGTISAQPDMAIVVVGVETQGDTATDALDQNNIAMREVLSATLATGVDNADVQTQAVRLNPIYSQPGDGGGTPTLSGYQASNTVQLTVRDLATLGTLLDAAVSAGGNTIQQIRFDFSDNSGLLVQAREAAMGDAIAKATQLTTLAGASLGEVVTINELGSSFPSPASFELADRALNAVPVQAGTQSVDATIQVTWRIE